MKLLLLFLCVVGVCFAKKTEELNYEEMMDAFIFPTVDTLVQRAIDADMPAELKRVDNIVFENINGHLAIRTAKYELKGLPESMKCNMELYPKSSYPTLRSNLCQEVH